MAKMEIGNTIKRLREMKKITQEELASYIMHPVTLSRIENGKIMPSMKTLEALFERLGYDPGKSANLFLHNKAVGIDKTVNELDTAMGKRNIAEMKSLLNKLEKNRRYMQENLNVQYITFMKGMTRYLEGGLDDALGLFIDAIKATIPGFCAESIHKYLLSAADRRIITMIAVIYKKNGQVEDAANLYYKLKENFDANVVDRLELGRQYTVLLFNLVLSLVPLGRYEEVLELCETCIKMCIDTGFGYVLPSITCYKAIALYETGKSASPDCLELLLKQAYYGCLLFEQSDDSEFVKNFAKEKLGLDL